MHFTIKSFSLFIIVIFYVLAGLNHFINPSFYLPLLPNYIPYHAFIVPFSGALEILLGLGLIFKISRHHAAYAIIAMLVAFIPSHVYFIEIGGCIDGGLCAPAWVGWVRLLIIHPLLLAWAWYHRK